MHFFYVCGICGLLDMTHRYVKMCIKACIYLIKNTYNQILDVLLMLKCFIYVLESAQFFNNKKEKINNLNKK